MMFPRIVPVSPTPMPALRSMVTRMLLPAVLPVLVIPPVPKMLTGVPDGKVNLGASLRDRATLPSPLRSLGPAGGYPSRLHSLRSLRAPLARRLAALTAVAGPPPSSSSSTASVARPPYAPRDGAARRARRSARLARSGRLRASPRDRRGSTPCVAGARFAAHRAPHYAVQSCPHQCGHFHPSLRQRAAHDCLRLQPHRRPLTRRGGSPPPGSPASIPPSDHAARFGLP